MDVIVLGAGLVGAPMAMDLNRDPGFNVTVADYNNEALEKLKGKYPEVSVLQKDLSDPDGVTTLVSKYDLAVNAVPGFMGFETAKAIIKAGKDSACIAFYEEDPFELDQLARDNDEPSFLSVGPWLVHCRRWPDPGG